MIICIDTAGFPCFILVICLQLGSTTFFLLAHLAKGIASYCHHLVRRRRRRPSINFSLFNLLL